MNKKRLQKKKKKILRLDCYLLVVVVGKQIKKKTPTAEVD